ncbi:hypothetical protein LBMAG56_17450 [Verrucomicrobiota bacterium]|nr:hypothetical protein LBMAG56_17450 [Verrucomicrobiota bacterium]
MPTLARPLPAVALLTAVLLAATATFPPLGAAQFKFRGQTLTVPDGFEIELVAPPTVVPRPISASFDEQGRLYVTDSAGMSDKADKQLAAKPHRVLRLESTKGDGRFDRTTVFADRMMFPEGCLYYEGSVYVAAPPQIWKLTDTDGDGVADKREVWFDGKTLTGCANDLHGPYLGPDGWFYWCKGAFAQQTYERPGQQPFVTRASHIFRARPDGTGIEPVLTGGMDNPVGFTYTADGERFLSCTFFQNPAGGKRDGLIHAIYGGVYGKDHDVLRDHPRTGDLMPVMTHMSAAAPCGLTTYRSRGLGLDFYDNLFACYFNLHKVVRHILVPDGATFKTKDLDFVTSDSHDFHPTDVLEDADGSLLIVDTGGWYKICCPTSQLAKPDVLGGIYRVRRTGMTAPADPRGLGLSLGRLKSADLIALLADERLVVQKQALNEIRKRGVSTVVSLRETVASPAAPASTRVQSIWALARINSPEARAAVRSALADTNTTIRHAATHAVSLWRDLAAYESLEKMVSGADASLARVAAEALGRLGDKRAVPVLLAAFGRLPESPVSATGSPTDSAARVLQHSLLYALIELADREQLLAHARTSTNPQIKRGALIALDQITDSGLKPEDVVPHLASTAPAMKQTAAWIISHRPDWGADVAGYFRERLGAKTLSPAEQSELPGQLAPLAKHAAIQDLLAATLRDAQATRDTRLLAMRTMAAAALKDTPAPWLTELARLLGNADETLARSAVATLRTVSNPKQPGAEVVAALAAAGRNAALPADIRLDALATLPAGAGEIDAALFDFLRANLAGTQTLTIRSAAATTLAKAKLTADQQLELAAALQTIGPLELPKLLPAFERAPTEALGRKLLASLKGSTGWRGLRTDLLKPLLAKYPPPVQTLGDELLKLLNADAAKEAAHLTDLLGQLKDGDIRRGMAVFNSAKSACATCHAIGYLGGRLGPDLTRIGGARNERDLLEAIVYPSASFVRSYEPFVVLTKGGEEFSGVLRKDAPEEVILATGPETEQRIARKDIAELRPGSVSIMPQGLDQVLTRQELADLLAFLKAAK